MHELASRDIYKPGFNRLTEVVPYGDGVITVSANLDRLRSDFLTEAQSHPEIDIAKAEKLGDKLQIFFDFDTFRAYVSEDKQIKLKQDNKGFLSPLWSKRMLKIVQGLVERGQLGGAAYNSETALALYLNPEVITAQIQVPETSSTEFHESAVIGKFYSVWRHEREHLIRLLDPKIRKSRRIRTIASSVTAASLSVSLQLANMHYVDSHPINGEIDIIRVVAAVVPSMYIASELSQILWYQLINPLEEFSREAQRKGKQLPNLFDFQFEN